MSVEIASVVKKPSGLWVITDTAGKKYATRNSWKASIADRARERGKKVLILSYSGWYYDDLAVIKEEEAA